MAEGGAPVENDIIPWEQAVERRQFACSSCDKSWWEDVLVQKPVSRCRRCRKKYDALARDKEFGVGEHKCKCGHSFTGWTSYGVTSPCFKCGADVLPKILPNRGDIKKTTNRRHKCEACDGKGKCPNKKAVVNASPEHESTGSTISSVYTEDDDRSTISSVCTEDDDRSTIVDHQETERRRREYNRALRDLDDDLRLLSVEDD